MVLRSFSHCPKRDVITGCYVNGHSHTTTTSLMCYLVWFLVVVVGYLLWLQLEKWREVLVHLFSVLHDSLDGKMPQLGLPSIQNRPF